MKKLYIICTMILLNSIILNGLFAQPCVQTITHCEALQTRNATTCPLVASWTNEAALAPQYSSGAVDVLGLFGSVSPVVSFSGFGFTIPADCTVCLLEVSITRQRTSNGLVVVGPFVFDNTLTVNGGANLAVGGGWPGAATAQVYNAGAGFTTAGVNAGVTLAMSVNVGAIARLTGATTAHVSAVSATVYVSWDEDVVIPCPLPVTLSYFKGEQGGTCAKVSWRTETELNNDYFIVEKLVGESYEEVGRVASKIRGEQGAIYYDLTDCSVSKMNYYRLIQVDLDGKREVLGQLVNVPVENTISGDIQIAPNPANDFVCVGSENVINELQLVSAEGRVIQTITVDGYSKQSCMDLGEHQAGVYSLVVKTNEGIFSERLIIE